jgi:hypothetical protein
METLLLKPGAARALIGLFGLPAFPAAALTIEPIGIAGAFAMATALALAIQGASLWIGPVRRPPR